MRRFNNTLFRNYVPLKRYIESVDLATKNLITIGAHPAGDMILIEYGETELNVLDAKYRDVTNRGRYVGI